jgi:hypothetical protein
VQEAGSKSQPEVAEQLGNSTNSFFIDAGSSDGGGWKISSTFPPAGEDGDEGSMEGRWQGSNQGKLDST